MLSSPLPPEYSTDPIIGYTWDAEVQDYWPLRLDVNGFVYGFANSAHDHVSRPREVTLLWGHWTEDKNDPLRNGA